MFQDFGADASPVQFRYGLGDGKSQSVTAVGGTCLIGAIETFKNFIRFEVFYIRIIIDDLQLNLSVCGELHRNFSLFVAVFHCIIHENGHNLTEL